MEFITFHQSYGYEEFVEGLRPESGGDGGGLRLKVRDGVLKRIAKKARSAPAAPVGNRRFYKVELGDRDIFEECMKDGCVRFGHSNTWSDEDWSDADYDAYDALMNRFEERWGPGAKHWWNSTSAATFRSKVNHGDIVVVPNEEPNSKYKYRAVGEVRGHYEYAARPSSPLWPHRRAVHWRWKAAGNPEPVGNFQEKRLGGQRVHQLHPDHPEVFACWSVPDPPSAAHGPRPRSGTPPASWRWRSFRARRTTGTSCSGKESRLRSPSAPGFGCPHSDWKPLPEGES